MGKESKMPGFISITRKEAELFVKRLTEVLFKKGLKTKKKREK